jgi:hypothetical protein
MFTDVLFRISLNRRFNPQTVPLSNKLCQNTAITKHLPKSDRRFNPQTSPCLTNCVGMSPKSPQSRIFW